MNKEDKLKAQKKQAEGKLKAQKKQAEVTEHLVCTIYESKTKKKDMCNITLFTDFAELCKLKQSDKKNFQANVLKKKLAITLDNSHYKLSKVAQLKEHGCIFRLYGSPDKRICQQFQQLQVSIEQFGFFSVADFLDSFEQTIKFDNLKHIAINVEPKELTILEFLLKQHWIRLDTQENGYLNDLGLTITSQDAINKKDLKYLNFFKYTIFVKGKADIINPQIDAICNRLAWKMKKIKNNEQEEANKTAYGLKTVFSYYKSLMMCGESDDYLKAMKYILCDLHDVIYENALLTVTKRYSIPIFRLYTVLKEWKQDGLYVKPKSVLEMKPKMNQLVKIVKKAWNRKNNTCRMCLTDAKWDKQENCHCGIHWACKNCYKIDSCQECLDQISI